MKSKPLDGGKKKKKGVKKRTLRGPTVAAMKSSKPPKANPFENIWSRRKFDIIGKKKGKGEEVRIGLSRSLAMEKRKKTLMKEYEESTKASKFIDRRLGEKDDSLPEFNKAILRMQRERQLKAKRERKYNLSDEEEEDPIDPRAVLLSKEDDFNEQVPLDDNDDDDHGGAGVSDLPRHLHLSSETDPSEHNLLDDTETFQGRKSNKQAYAEVMAKNKYYKAKRAVEREEINQEIAALNKLTEEMEDRLHLLNSLDWKHSSDKPSDDTYDNYYKIIGELHFEPRARPSDKMKTPEEIALEEKEALEKKEKERLKRMHASDDDDDDSDDTEGQSKPLSKMDRYISGDDLGDSFSTVKDAENGKGWVDDIYEREKNDDNHKEDSSSAEDSESMEDDQEGSDDSDGKDGDVADGIEYDKISSMKDWEKSDDDNDDDLSDEIAKQNLDEKGIIKMNLDSNKSESTDQYQVGFTEKPTLVKEEIPYVIQAPKTLSEMCSLLDNHSDTEVVEIIRRIRAYNSINLGTENRRKMQVFYGVLLSYFASSATQKPLNVKIINSLVQPLIEMGTEVPYFASVCARERLVQTRKQLCEDVKIPGKSSWPSLKTINLLRLWSLTFPCSDFRHAVITPAILLICEYLTRCPITSGRDIAVGSFLCSMALSVAKQSLKYFPEVLSFLQTILESCMEKNSTHEYPAQSHMELNVSQPWLLIHDEGCDVHPIDVFTVLEMDADSSYFNSDNFKASILSNVIKILKEFASIYERLSSFPEIFLPIAALLHEVLQGAKIPCILQGDINDAVGFIRKKISEHQALRQPLQMRKQKPEPIKLLNPKFEENFVKGINYDPDRERAQRKKLKKLLKKESKGAVRELRKDNHFIFKLKERDRLLQEEERAEKYGKALAFLQEQEHAFKSGQLGKGRKKRK